VSEVGDNETPAGEEIEPDAGQKTIMTANLNLQRLRDAGVSIWLDTLSREQLEPDSPS